jgi:hypothetical protein
MVLLSSLIAQAAVSPAGRCPMREYRFDWQARLEDGAFEGLIGGGRCSAYAAAVLFCSRAATVSFGGPSTAGVAAFFAESASVVR